MTTRKTIALTVRTFVGKVMALLFNTLWRHSSLSCPHCFLLLLTYNQPCSSGHWRSRLSIRCVSHGADSLVGIHRQESVLWRTLNMSRECLVVGVPGQTRWSRWPFPLLRRPHQPRALLVVFIYFKHLLYLSVVDLQCGNLWCTTGWPSYTYMCIFFLALSQDSEYSSLCCIVGACSSIPYIMDASADPKVSTLHPLPTPPSNHKPVILCVCECFVDKSICVTFKIPHVSDTTWHLSLSFWPCWSLSVGIVWQNCSIRGSGYSELFRLKGLAVAVDY